MFTPILSATDLPTEGVDHETLHLDFKATSNRSTAWEKAKDAAAFANAQGGTILIAAAEDKSRGVIGVYRWMDDQSAATVKREFEEAIRDRCRPQPVFDVANVSVPEKGRAVAVNVWPFIGQPVGVKPDLPSGYSDVFSFAFPVRVGTGTIYLSADQLPMFMLPELRRTAILLAAIPAHERARIRLFRKRSADDRSEDFNEDVELVLDGREIMLENAVRFRRLRDLRHFTIPADRIIRTWKNADGRWNIKARVYLTDTELNAISIDD